MPIASSVRKMPARSWELRNNIYIFAHLNTLIMEEKEIKGKTSAIEQNTIKVKTVRNRSGHRVELVSGDKVIVFLPGKSVEVPADLEIPGGIGLYVR